MLRAVLPTDAIARSSLSPAQTLPKLNIGLGQYLQRSYELKRILNTALEPIPEAPFSGHAIVRDILNRLTTTIHQIREILHRDLTKATATDRKLRRTVNRIAAEQGFKDFVEDIEYAVAGQIGYRFVGQILLFRPQTSKIPTLKELKLSAGDVLTNRLLFNHTGMTSAVMIPYEALFKPEPWYRLNNTTIAEEVARLIAHLTDYLYL